MVRHFIWGEEQHDAFEEIKKILKNYQYVICHTLK